MPKKTRIVSTYNQYTTVTVLNLQHVSTPPGHLQGGQHHYIKACNKLRCCVQVISVQILFSMSIQLIKIADVLKGI